MSRAKRKRLYSVRSALSHGGRLLAADLPWTSFRPEHTAEWTDLIEAYEAVRVTIVNWLIERSAFGDSGKVTKLAKDYLAMTPFIASGPVPVK